MESRRELRGIKYSVLRSPTLPSAGHHPGTLVARTRPCIPARTLTVKQKHIGEKGLHAGPDGSGLAPMGRGRPRFTPLRTGWPALPCLQQASCGRQASSPQQAHRTQNKTTTPNPARHGIRGIQGPGAVPGFVGAHSGAPRLILHAPTDKHPVPPLLQRTQILFRTFFVRRIFRVKAPAERVGRNVFPDAFQIGTVADDMFVITALPDGGAGGSAKGVDSAGRRRFALRHKRSQRSRSPVETSRIRRGAQLCARTVRPHIGIGRPHDSVYVVGHDDPRIQSDSRTEFFRAPPFLLRDPPAPIEAHLAVDDLAEKEVFR
jgi:hypothetical protein